MKSATWMRWSPLALLPAAAMAGPLYGTVRIGNAPAAGIELVVACPGFNGGAIRAQGKTDASGGYSLNVPASGRCEMRAQGNGRTGAPFAVFVASNPALFDFRIDAALNRVP